MYVEVRGQVLAPPNVFFAKVDGRLALARMRHRDGERRRRRALLLRLLRPLVGHRTNPVSLLEFSFSCTSQRPAVLETQCFLSLANQHPMTRLIVRDCRICSQRAHKDAFKMHINI